MSRFGKLARSALLVILAATVSNLPPPISANQLVVMVDYPEPVERTTVLCNLPASPRNADFVYASFPAEMFDPFVLTAPKVEPGVSIKIRCRSDDDDVYGGFTRTTCTATGRWTPKVSKLGQCQKRPTTTTTLATTTTKVRRTTLWVQPAGEEAPVYCPLPATNGSYYSRRNDTWRLLTGTHIIAGSEVDLRCDDGFELTDGTHKGVCSEDGGFVPDDLGSCTEKVLTTTTTTTTSTTTHRPDSSNTSSSTQSPRSNSTLMTSTRTTTSTAVEVPTDYEDYYEDVTVSYVRVINGIETTAISPKDGNNATLTTTKTTGNFSSTAGIGTTLRANSTSVTRTTTKPATTSHSSTRQNSSTAATTPFTAAKNTSATSAAPSLNSTTPLTSSKSPTTSPTVASTSTTTVKPTTTISTTSTTTKSTTAMATLTATTSSKLLHTLICMCVNVTITDSPGTATATVANNKTTTLTVSSSIASQSTWTAAKTTASSVVTSTQNYNNATEETEETDETEPTDEQPTTTPEIFGFNETNMTTTLSYQNSSITTTVNYCLLPVGSSVEKAPSFYLVLPDEKSAIIIQTARQSPAIGVVVQPGNKIVMKCPDDYPYVNGATRSQCLGNLMWSIDFGSCMAVRGGGDRPSGSLPLPPTTLPSITQRRPPPGSHCGYLPLVDNGSIQDGAWSAGALRKVSCQTGYKLIGAKRIKCCSSTAEWTDPGYCYNEGDSMLRSLPRRNRRSQTCPDDVLVQQAQDIRSHGSSSMRSQIFGMILSQLFFTCSLVLLRSHLFD